MSKVVKIRRGLDIRLQGEATKTLKTPELTGLFAIKPTDFKGLDLRVLVKPGDTVRIGTPILADKFHPDIVLVSPVAGTVEAVNRGERRRLMEVVVRAGGVQDSVALSREDPGVIGADRIREQILQSGLWPALIQRPYGIVANPSDTPRDIFISAFDTSPLAPDYDFILQSDRDSFVTGIKALSYLTSGKVYLSVSPGQVASPVFSNIHGVEYTVFDGPHPAGNTGIQIHHLAPVNKGEVIWTVAPQFVALIGRTFLAGQAGFRWKMALAGSRVQDPGYVEVITGAQVSAILTGNLIDAEQEPRVISGTVLTGMRIERDGFIGFYDSLVSVIPEGNYFSLLGWMAPGMNKFSNTRTFLSSLFRRKNWDLDTNLNGGHRAFVVTGQYEKVLPMDIYPVHLLKAILVNDIDRMEQLGIYEVIEEDLALCEVVCTSKTDVQEILRTGLDLLRKEMS